MNLLNFKEIFLYSVFILLEVKLLFLLQVYNIKPSIFIIFLILKSLDRGKPKLSALIGFAAGLLLDFFNADYLGLSSLSFSLIAFCSGYLGEFNEKLTKTRIFTFSFVMITIHALIYYLIKGFGLDYYYLFFQVITPTICYTSLLQIIITYFIPHNKKKKEI